jgi:hypothetical protein
MPSIVLRVRLTSGDQLDVAYDDMDAENQDAILERVIARLAQDSGVLRTSHGERLLVLYGRGVAGFEVSPRGAVL